MKNSKPLSMRENEGVTKTVTESWSLGKGSSGSSDSNCDPLLKPPMAPLPDNVLAAA